MSKIKSIKAGKILDSRANWTVEVDLVTEQGLFRSSVPSGASKGKHEAPTVSVEKAIKNINEIIAPKLKGKDATSQKEIDSFLDPENSAPMLLPGFPWLSAGLELSLKISLYGNTFPQFLNVTRTIFVMLNCRCRLLMLSMAEPMPGMSWIFRNL